MPRKISPEILEIKILARAGQGAKTAAQVVAEAALVKDLHFQAFPEFGPERRGAPVKAYVRLSPQPIDLHSQIEAAAITVVIEPQFVESIEEKTILIANTTESEPKISAAKIYSLDASKIAQFFLGKNIPNLVMVGALISVIKKEFPDFKIDLEASINVVKERFSEKWGSTLTEKNIIAMRKGFEEVRKI